jgi:hypothetical protein
MDFLGHMWLVFGVLCLVECVILYDHPELHAWVGLLQMRWPEEQIKSQFRASFAFEKMK